MTTPTPPTEEPRDPWPLLQNARGAARRLTSILIANAHRLDVPFTDDPRTPWSAHVSPAINNLRAALGMRGAWPTGCACDFHGRNCEPPSELCCDQCSEIQHPAHVDGSVCSAPDLGGTAMPTRVEIDLRAEIDRLLADLNQATAVVEAAEALAAWLRMKPNYRVADLWPHERRLVAAVDAWRSAQSCTCPDVDITPLGEPPRSKTMKGYTPGCPVCPNPYSTREGG